MSSKKKARLSHRKYYYKKKENLPKEVVPNLDNGKKVIKSFLYKPILRKKKTYDKNDLEYCIDQLCNKKNGKI